MENRSNFNSKIGVVLAAAGSAVGLGNVWRFPTEVAQHGGAAYIVVYILCAIFVGLPIMLGEFVIGRHTHANTIDAYKKLAPRTGWIVQGYLGWFVAWLILSYYSVIAGWTLKYLFAAITNDVMNQADTTSYFTDFTSGNWLPVIFTIAVLLITHFIISRGVQSGIEKFSKIMMPMLFVMIVVLGISSLALPGAAKGLAFLFNPDFSKVNGDVFLSAMGQAFFSLSVGMGCLVTYASYFSDDTSLTRTAGSVITIDTMVAILSGFFIFPAIFSVTDTIPEAGPGLVFITLPNMFSLNFAQVPLLGSIFSVVFYLLLLLAAITSTISLHEVVTAFFVEHGFSRRKGAAIVTGVCIILGMFCTWSFGPLKDFTPFFGMNFFDFFDFFAAKILMPIGGVIVALFMGWYLDKKIIYDELTNRGKLWMPFFKVYIFILKYLAPIAITCIFLHELDFV